jgi:hypothetical protein
MVLEEVDFCVLKVKARYLDGVVMEVRDCLWVLVNNHSKIASFCELGSVICRSTLIELPKRWFDDCMEVQ